MIKQLGLDMFPNELFSRITTLEWYEFDAWTHIRAEEIKSDTDSED